MLLFLLDRVLVGPEAASSEGDDSRIVISNAFVEGLRARIEETTGRPPRDAEVEDAVREYVRDEALSREARAARLDRGDPIVRRRLIQKIEFVLEGAAALRTPNDAELQAYLDAHASDFALPERIELTQLFFADSAEASERVSSALRMLDAGQTPDSDPHPRGPRLGPMTKTQLDSALGEGAFDAIAGYRVGVWQGPLRSAAGLHLIRVEERIAASVPTLEQVRERIVAAWTDEHRRQAIEREVARILERYRIVREDHES